METSVEIKPVTWRMVTETVKLSKLQLRSVVKTGIFRAPESDDAPVSDQLLTRVLTADMLERLAFLKPEQRALILDESQEAQRLAYANLMQLAFVEGRYCTWTGYRGFLDLESGETITELPVPPMETISYNLQELFRRGKHQIEKRNGYHGQHQDPKSPLDEPPDVLERPADGVS
jgi:hypothetical protein